jgi:putative membrane protein
MTTTTGDWLLRLLVVAVLVLLLVPMLVMVFAFPLMGGWMMGGRYGVFGAMSVWGWLIMLLPLGLLVALGVLVYRILRDSEFGTDPALSELRMAYARGDISEEEFERRRERLRGEN